jgi:hypothetical protein
LPYQDGYIESLNGKLRDELLNVEIFTTLFEAQVLIEIWRKDYNQIFSATQIGSAMRTCLFYPYRPNRVKEVITKSKKW